MNDRRGRRAWALLVVHTEGRFEPPVFALGARLQEEDFRVLVVSYRKANSPKWGRLPGGVRILRLDRALEDSRHGLFAKAIRWTSFCISIATLLYRLGPSATVLFSYDLLPIAVVARSLSRMFVYYCTEYSESAKLGTLRTGWGILKLVEKAASSWTDVTVSVEPRRAALLESQLERRVDYVVVNAPSFNRAQEEKAWAATRERRPGLRLVYAGSIDERNCLHPLIEAVTRVPGVSLAIFGRLLPEYEKTFRTAIEDANARRPEAIQYRGCVEYPALHDTLTRYDVGVTLYSSNSTNTALAAPAKLLDYMKAGLAVLTTAQPLPEDIVQTAGCGVVLRDVTVDALTASISVLGQSGAELVEMRRRSLEAFREHWTSEIQTAPLVRRITQLCS